jgi:hypothetical protein
MSAIAFVKDDRSTLSTNTHVPYYPPDIFVVRDWFSRYGTNADEVRAFCREHGLQAEAKRAVSLIEKYFPWSESRLDVCGDPDGDEKWLIVRFDVPGPVEEVLASYRRMKREWTDAPGIESSRLIRFIYNIV